ncbi:HCL652Cp [Eremothecium sinecaudum]|uniref:Autophagy-related protein n=1 Tax=Eremothecium sinecaudum TaxID=45286 RepID=A0A120K1L1_9SACH|nr:HCL652Cp [Eremothecium sinecaudum]AMD19499.1 HCL652Cp [Eremothecium sinecaudum]
MEHPEVNYSSIPRQDTGQETDMRQVKRNVIGWYIYSFSSEPYIVSAIATYIPLLLENFARANGVRVDNHSQVCVSADDRCVLPMFGRRVFVDTSSFALYTFAVGVFVQTLLVISVSGMVDLWNSVTFKRNVVLSFGFVGGLSTSMMAVLRKTQYYELALLCIISNSCYGVVNVVGNSILPTLVADMNLKDEDGPISKSADQMITLISGRGSGLGYLAALIVQLISILLVMKSSDDNNVQVALAFVGMWWLAFQIPMIWFLRDTNFTSVKESQFKLRDSGRYIAYGWRSLFDAISRVRLLRDVVIFLVGWFIVSDSVSTINSTAVLFARTELMMNTVQLIVVSILTMVNAVLGAFLVPELFSKKFKLSSQYILIGIICWTAIVPLYGILGFATPVMGLKHQWEMYILAVWYGVALGSLGAVSRSVFTLIIPKGKESTFFSLFNVTDKGSSILGPILVGLITDRTHNIRYSFFLLLGFLILSLPVFYILNVDRGKLEASELSSIDGRSEE